jgi:hypothetical protein
LAHRSTERHAMDMGPTANERGRQTTSSIRTQEYLEVIWHSWCRGELGSPHKSQGSAPHHRISLSPEISKESQLWAATEPPTGQLWTWDWRQMKEHIKLHILLARWIIWCTSWVVGAGVNLVPHRNLRGSAPHHRIFLRWEIRHF